MPRMFSIQHRKNLSLVMMGNRNGSNPSEETRSKRSVALKGHSTSEETKQKISAARKGIRFSDKHRKNLSESHKGKSKSEKHRQLLAESQRRLWNSKDYRDSQRKKIIAAQHISPNKPEQVLQHLLDNRFPGDWKFVGDGSVVFNGYNPDFINVNGKKLIIELFGDYWHRGEDPADRAKLFEPFGFRTLVIWEHELKNMGKVEKRISSFMEKL